MTIPLTSSREEVATNRAWFSPANAYTVGLLLVNLAALSLAFFDAKGTVLFVLSLMYTAHLRLLLTGRAEQRRTNELLEELLEIQSPLPRVDR